MGPSPARALTQLARMPRGPRGCTLPSRATAPRCVSVLRGSSSRSVFGAGGVVSVTFPAATLDLRRLGREQGGASETREALTWRPIESRIGPARIARYV